MKKGDTCKKRRIRAKPPKTSKADTKRAQIEVRRFAELIWEEYRDQYLRRESKPLDTNQKIRN